MPPLDGSSPELTDLAAQRHGDPAKALARVDDLASSLGQDAPLARLLWIRGLLLHELGKSAEAKATFESAIARALAEQNKDVEARARANLAISLIQVGRNLEADVELNLARSIAPESAQGVVTYLGALSQQRRGDHRAALVGYERAIGQLEAVGDRATIGVLHLNRAVSLTYLEEREAALRHLRIAEEVATEFDLTILAAMAAHNEGFLQGLQGNLADALRSLDRAEARYLGLQGRPRQLPVLLSDRAEILLGAGLVADARVAAQQALEELQRSGNIADFFEAQLLLARICLSGEAFHEARAAAVSAAWGFRESRRSAWAIRAIYFARLVDFAIAQSQALAPTALVGQFNRVAEELLRRGWAADARDGFVSAAIAAIECHDPVTAKSLLARASRIRGSQTTQTRAREHFAHAALVCLEENPRGALRRTTKGIRELSQHRLRLGATEARFEILRFSEKLADLGTTLALRVGESLGILRIVEQQRAMSSYLPKPQSTSGSTIGDDERRASSSLENEIREHSFRTRSSPGPQGMDVPLSWSRLRGALGSRALIYYLSDAEKVYAIIVRTRTTEVVEIASKGDLHQNHDYLLLAMHRLAFDASTDGRARRIFDREAMQLDEMLIAPLGLGDQPVTIVPSTELSGMEWLALPSLRNRAISIAPSGKQWLQAASRPSEPPSRVCIVGGPRLDAADEEVQRVASMYPNADVLIGSDATVANILRAFERADLIHIAAHGVFRPESPMFSRLELVDGSITLYDLENLRRTPPLIILSACQSAANKSYPGGGTLGTASALLALGARCVVAALHPITDRASCDHMITFHQELVTGASPAEALRQAAIHAYEKGDNNQIVAASVFVPLGAG